MEKKIFNPKKLEILNNPGRLEELPPELIVKNAKLENPKVIVDLGAGTGFFSIPFAEMFSQCKVYACDISDIMLDWMKENVLPKHGNIIPMRMENNSVPLSSGIADFLIMINLHHELDSPDKTLAECYRLLKYKGKIAISDWKKEKTDHGPSIEIRYEAKEIKKQLQNAGFDNISIYSELPSNYLIIAEKQD